MHQNGSDECCLTLHDHSCAGRNATPLVYILRTRCYMAYPEGGRGFKPPPVESSEFF